MDKKALICTIAKKAKIDRDKAEIAVNNMIVEAVSPHIFRKPGGEVGLLDNSCTNNCKPADVARIKTVAKRGR